jgi:hypothetical protein
MQMIDEILIYRVVGVGFLVGLPVTLYFAFRPARTVAGKRARLASAAFIGFGTCFVGWASSWPGPNFVTSVMMVGGLVVFLLSVCRLVRSCCFDRRKSA